MCSVVGWTCNKVEFENNSNKMIMLSKKKVTENKQWAMSGDSASAVYSRSMVFFGGMWRHNIKAVRKIFGDKHGALPSKEK